MFACRAVHAPGVNDNPGVFAPYLSLCLSLSAHTLSFLCPCKGIYEQVCTNASCKVVLASPSPSLHACLQVRLRHLAYTSEMSACPTGLPTPRARTFADGRKGAFIAQHLSKNIPTDTMAYATKLFFFLNFIMIISPSISNIAWQNLKMTLHYRLSSTNS